MMATVSVLADPPKNTGPDFGKASPVGLLVVVLLLIGVFILVWSMNKHLKRLPKTFDTDTDTEAGQDQAGTADGGRSETPEDTSEATAEKPAHEPGG